MLVSTRLSSLHLLRKVPPIFQSDEQSTKANILLVEYSCKRRRCISTSHIECDGNAHSHRYLITNYEYNNFSVAQAQFQDNVPTDIVPIPSKNIVSQGKQRKLSTSSLVGISVGAFLVLIMLVLILPCALRRRKNAENRSHDSPRILKSGSPSYTPPSIPTQEIGRNSSYTVNHELQDNGIVEMHDQYPRAEMGNDIAELPQPPPQRVSDVVDGAAHEIYTRTTSSRTLSENTLERRHPAALDPSLERWAIPKALKLTQNSTKTLRRNLSTPVAISKYNVDSPISSQCGPARDDSTPRDLADQMISSTRSSLQTTYANLFDYDLYVSRRGTSAGADNTGHT